MLLLSPISGWRGSIVSYHDIIVASGGLLMPAIRYAQFPESETIICEPRSGDWTPGLGRYIGSDMRTATLSGPWHKHWQHDTRGLTSDDSDTGPWPTSTENVYTIARIEINVNVGLV